MFFSPRKSAHLRTASFFILLVFSILAAPPLSRAEGEGISESKILKIGTTAPLFTAKNIQDVEFKLDEHVGQRPVLLFFWSFFCGPCREEMPILQQVYEDLGKDKLTFVGVNLDGAKLAKAIDKFMQDSGFDFTVVFDELDGLDYKIADPYGVVGTPTLYIVGLNGQVHFSAVGKVEPEELKTVLEGTLGGG